MTICEVRGDLLRHLHGLHAVGHCISRDARLSRGFARLLKQRFPHLRNLQPFLVPVGDIYPLFVCDQGLWIYNLVTKCHFYEKPSYATIESSLLQMRHHAWEHGVSKIGLVRLASGLDRLKWSIVRNIIAEVFLNSNINIFIYFL